MSKGQKRSSREAMKPKAKDSGTKKVPKYMEASGPIGQVPSQVSGKKKEIGRPTRSGLLIALATRSLSSLLGHLSGSKLRIKAGPAIRIRPAELDCAQERAAEELRHSPPEALTRAAAGSPAARPEQDLPSRTTGAH